MIKSTPSLFTLCFIEIWDRFSYYGVQAILVIYLTQKFLLQDNAAYFSYGVYTTLAFALPVLGGLVADKFLGRKVSVILGVLLTLFGNILLIFEINQLLYIALSLIVCGIGFFKANNTALVGQLYIGQDRKNRSYGFTWFYIAMNVGAILGPIIFGYIAMEISWSAAFTISSCGLLVSLALFIFKTSSLTAETINLIKISKVFAVIIVPLAILWCLFHFKDLFIITVILMIIVILCYALYIAATEPIYRATILLLIVFDIFAMFYFSASMQIGSSFMLFVQRYIHINLFGQPIPATAYAALDPIFVILAAPLLAPVWKKLKKSSTKPIVITRIWLSLILATIGFYTFGLAAYFPILLSPFEKFGLIVLGNFFLGAGELCLAPAVIEAVTYLAPSKLQGLYMGFWYLFVAFAAYIGSLLAQIGTHNLNKMHIGSLMYAHTFFTTATIMLIVSIIFLFLTPFLYRFLPKVVNL